MTATPALSGKPVMEQLKEATLAEHASAEGHPFQRAMVSGRLPKAQYIANLGQLLLVHRELEGRLRREAAQNEWVAGVIRDYQYQEPYLLDDLVFYGIDPATVKPGLATARVIEQIGVASLHELLGMHYVLEGSKNGAKYICRAVLKAYGLTPGAGTRYLDPYGDRQRDYWAAFKTDMNAVGFSQDHIDESIAGAKAMFVAIERIGDDVLAGT